MTTVAVLGAGPHGRSVAAVLDDLYLDVVLCDDDRDANAHLPDTLSGATRFPWVVGAAWPEVRREIIGRLADAPDPVKGAYHDGVVLFPGARVDPAASVGAHVHVGYNAVVTHGVTVGECTTVGPGAVVGGEASIGHEAFIGAAAVVIHGGLTIGARAMVGAGAVVVDDVPDDVVVVGNPARIVAPDWHHADMPHGRRTRAIFLARDTPATRRHLTARHREDHEPWPTP